MISLLVTFIIVLLIFSVAWWVIGLFPIPAPFGNVIRAVLGLILLIWLISVLLPYAGLGHPLLR